MELKEIIKNARRKWETPKAPAMLCKTCKKNKHGKPAARLMISSLSLYVSWKPVNQQECAWKNLYRNIMGTISQEKGTIHYSITIWWPGGWGPKACQKQAAADSWGSRTCVCANTFDAGVAHAGEGWFNILPWYRLDGVAIPPVSRKGGRAGLPPRGTDDSPHLSLPKPAVFRWQ